MNKCQNCGKLNTPETNFCRFCGTKFHFAQKMPDNPYDYSPPPRPYAWKTDEFQTQNEPRKTVPIDRIQPQTGQPMQPGPMHPGQSYKPAPLANYTQGGQYGGQMAQRPGYAIDGNYHCPNCGSSYLPIMERRISTAGWIVFAVLLVFTFIFFWVGLLMKEDVGVCPVCRFRVTPT